MYQEPEGELIDDTNLPLSLYLVTKQSFITDADTEMPPYIFNTWPTMAGRRGPRPSAYARDPDADPDSMFGELHDACWMLRLLTESRRWLFTKRSWASERAHRWSKPPLKSYQ